jgi:hypothetical protein
MTAIVINGISVDTEDALPPPRSVPQDYFVILPNQPLTAEQRAVLTREGVIILEAAGDALICWYDRGEIALVSRAVADISFPYPEVVKITPPLLGLRPRPGGIAAADAATRIGTLDQTMYEVWVVLHRNVEGEAADRAADEIKAAAGVIEEEDFRTAPGKVFLRVAADRLWTIAAVDAVHHIERIFPPGLLNNKARDILRVPGGDFPPGSEGAGEIVAIADTGLDTGSLTHVHRAFGDRVLDLIPLGRDQQAWRTADADDPNGHGTHVAGSVLGDDPYARPRVRGTAPKAQLIMQSLYLTREHPLDGLPDDLRTLFKPPYDAGARVHNNSWGSTSPMEYGEYHQWAFELDDFVYANPEMVVCVAAGNGGVDEDGNGVIDEGSLSPPGTAKNCITIGATENVRDDQKRRWSNGFRKRYKGRPFASDRVADQEGGMAAFSGRGPTNDFRIKPDVVAPGTFILSARSRITEATGWGLPDEPDDHMFNGGTSMATPLVSGCAANVRAFLRGKNPGQIPSAALIKAALINGARPISGQYAAPYNDSGGPVPNNHQGFGLVDLGAALGLEGETVKFIDDLPLLDTGQDVVLEEELPKGTGMLKVTLVWTDAPSKNGIQSDLDLAIRIGPEERHGNMPPKSKELEQAKSEEFDRVNNVEQIVWETPPAGTALIGVRAYRALAPQRFALVIRKTMAK